MWKLCSGLAPLVEEDLEDYVEPVSAQIPWCTRIWAAVIRRAAVDWVLYSDHVNPKRKKLGEDAGKWLFESDDCKRLNSFVSVCHVMGIPPETMRKKVEALTEEEARRLRGMEFGDDR